MIKRVLKSWATLSLAAGAFATCFDIALGTTLLHFGTPTRVAAMVGTSFGSTIAFFLNRYVAFREKRDAGLEAPTLILPSIQVNIRAGELPEPEANGTSYLKIPLNVLGGR